MFAPAGRPGLRTQRARRQRRRAVETDRARLHDDAAKLRGSHLQGLPVLYFHGSPGTATVAPASDSGPGTTACAETAEIVVGKITSQFTPA